MCKWGYLSIAGSKPEPTFLFDYDFPQTRQTELPTGVVQHFTFIMKARFFFQGKSVKSSLLASTDKSCCQSLLPFDSWQKLE